MSLDRPVTYKTEPTADAPISMAMLSAIEWHIENGRVDRVRFLQHYKIKRVEDMNCAQFADAIHQINRKIRQANDRKSGK